MATTAEKTKTDESREDRDEASVKRVRVEEDEDKKAEAAAAPVFGLGAKGFASVSKSSGWLKDGVGGTKPFAFGAGGGTGFKSFGDISNQSDKQTPFSFNANKPSTSFSFSTKPSSGTSSFSFGGLGASSVATAVVTEGKDDNETEKKKDESDEVVEENKFGSNIEGLAAEPEFKTASSHGVHMPEEDGEQLTGEEEENVVISLRAKLYQLVPRVTKKPKTDETVAKVDKEEEDKVEEGKKADASQEKEPKGQIGQNEWRECGVGNIRLLIPKKGTGGRLVMRREKTESLILNVNLATVSPSRVSDKATSFSCMQSQADDQQPIAATYLLKTKQKEDMEKFFTSVTTTKEKSSQ